MIIFDKIRIFFYKIMRLFTRKKLSAIKIETKNFVFNRDEANER
jgi:hypothetical protein